MPSIWRSITGAVLASMVAENVAECTSPGSLGQLMLTVPERECGLSHSPPAACLPSILTTTLRLFEPCATSAVTPGISGSRLTSIACPVGLKTSKPISLVWESFIVRLLPPSGVRVCSTLRPEITASAALTMPTPSSSVLSLLISSGLAEPSRISSRSWQVKPGPPMFATISAATPDTCGQAIDVPCIVPYLPPGRVLSI